MVLLLHLKNLLGRVGRIAGNALDAAFPASCVSCGDLVEGTPLPHVCDRCFSRIYIVEEPRCLTCGYPFFGETESRNNCSHCDRLVPRFAQGWSVALFRGPVRDLIYALKYEKGFWAIEDLVKIASYAEGLSDYVKDALLIPVPLHPRKRRERGYNQSALIAAELSRAFQVNHSDELLIRAIDTPSQTGFNRQDRYRNLKNAFSCPSKPAIDRRQRYIIVDDVFTTGSTLNACAAALRQAGAKRVDVLTLGHG